MSSISITGNITYINDLRSTAGGTSVLSAGVAENRKNGDVETTVFYAVTLWDSLAENVHGSLDRGDRVVLTGRMTPNVRPGAFANKDGELGEVKDITSLEVTADSFGPDLRFATATVVRNPKAASAGQEAAAPRAKAANAAAPAAAPVEDDEEPF